ncbi:hypothetical protein [Nocardia sp. NPDC003963]
MAATLQQLHAKTHWTSSNMPVLERLVSGLRHSPCYYTDPIRGYSHALHVMAIHAGHRCSRYATAAQYVEAQP